MTVLWDHLNFAAPSSSVSELSDKVVCQNASIEFLHLQSYFGTVSLLPEGPTFSLRTVVLKDYCFIMNAGLVPVATF